MTTRASVLALCLLAGCSTNQITSPDAAILCATGQVVTAAGTCVEQCASSCVTDSDCSGGLVCLSADGGCTECGAAPSLDAGASDGGDAGPVDGGVSDGGASDAGDGGSSDAGASDAGAADGGDGGQLDGGS